MKRGREEYVEEDEASFPATCTFRTARQQLVTMLFSYAKVSGHSLWENVVMALIVPFPTRRTLGVYLANVIAVVLHVHMMCGNYSTSTLSYSSCFNFYFKNNIVINFTAIEYSFCR